MNLPLVVSRTGTGALTMQVTFDGKGTVEIDYFELFPSQFTIVLGPGSSEMTDDNLIDIECAPTETLKLSASGTDVTDQLTALIASGQADDELTEFRRIVHVRVGDLLAGLSGTVELVATVDSGAANIEIRRVEPACQFDGDPQGKKVLITGFQPFPVNVGHDNVSGAAVAAMRPSVLTGAQVMRIILPVEYDDAPSEVISAINRCQPDVVISFGQGGGTIDLEHTAYNLKDSSEIAGGAPDNRGEIADALPNLDHGRRHPPERVAARPHRRRAHRRRRSQRAQHRPRSLRLQRRVLQRGERALRLHDRRVHSLALHQRFRRHRAGPLRPRGGDGGDRRGPVARSRCRSIIEPPTTTDRGALDAPRRRGYRLTRR